MRSSEVFPEKSFRFSENRGFFVVTGFTIVGQGLLRLSSDRAGKMGKTRDVSRKVFFYGIHFGEIHAPEPFETTEAAFKKLATLTSESEDWYLRIGPQKSVCAWLHDDDHRRVILGSVRSGELPEVEDRGARLPLPLKKHQNIVECAHLMLFPPGIIGAEFNFYGPKAPVLAEIMSRQLGLPAPTIFPLLNEDIRQTLDDVGEIKALQVRIHRDYIAQLDDSEESSGSDTMTLAGAFRALESMSNAPVIEVVLRQKPHSRKSLGSKARKILRSLAGMSNRQEALEKFTAHAVNVNTDKIVDFDFLRDAFVSVKKVARKGSRSRAVRSDSMFEAIEEAYNEIRPRLKKATGLRLP